MSKKCKFIYVFTKEAKDNLVNHGFTLLKDNEEQSFYVFVNNSELFFDLCEDEYVMTDTMTF